MKRYNEEHRDELNEYWRDYYGKNKKRILSNRKGSTTGYCRKWREKNRDEYNAYHREYYKRKKGVENETEE